MTVKELIDQNLAEVVNAGKNWTGRLRKYFVATF